MCWRHTPCVCCAETPLGGGGGACQMASGGLRYHRPNHFWQARCFINIWLSMKELEQEGGAEAAQPSKTVGAPLEQLLASAERKLNWRILPLMSTMSMFCERGGLDVGRREPTCVYQHRCPSALAYAAYAAKDPHVPHHVVVGSYPARQGGAGGTWSEHLRCPLITCAPFPWKVIAGVPVASGSELPHKLLSVSASPSGVKQNALDRLDTTGNAHASRFCPSKLFQ